jgi:hypothetical protein
MKRKPILIISLPILSEENKSHNMYKLKQIIEDQGMNKDYYILVYMDNTIESIQFKLLKTSNIDVEKYNELKELIKNSVKIK